MCHWNILLYFRGIDGCGTYDAYTIFLCRKVAGPYHTDLIHKMVMLYFRLPYFHVWNSALFFTQYFCTLISYRRSRDTFYTNWMRYVVFFVSLYVPNCYAKFVSNGQKYFRLISGKIMIYGHTSNVRRTLLDNNIVDHSTYLLST